MSESNTTLHYSKVQISEQDIRTLGHSDMVQHSMVFDLDFRTFVLFWTCSMVNTKAQTLPFEKSFESCFLGLLGTFFCWQSLTSFFLQLSIQMISSFSKSEFFVFQQKKFRLRIDASIILKSIYTHGDNRFYSNGRCKYAKECRFEHPKMCKKFIKNGPLKKQNPKGCDGKFEKFHHCKTEIKKYCSTNVNTS